jgi:hypothetical protein
LFSADLRHLKNVGKPEADEPAVPAKKKKTTKKQQKD